MGEKAQNIGILINDFRNWHSCPVACARFDTDQMRRSTQVRSLKCGGILKAVPRDNAVVGIGCGDQNGRIIAASGDIVIGGIAAQDAKILFLVGETVIGRPCTAIPPTVEPQHIHHANIGVHRIEQVGTAIGNHTHQ
jgi:hypothetical protein